MTVPAQPTSWQGEPPDPRDRSRALRRAVMRGTGLVLAASALLVAAGSWPVVEAAIAGPQAIAARRGIERAMRARGWAAGPSEPAEHRVFGPSHLDPFRGGDPIRIPSPLGRERPDHYGQHQDQSLEGRSVRAGGRIALLQNADPASPAEVTVDERMPLHVVTDLGTWLLLAVRLEGQMHLGWAPRESIVTLP